MNICRPIWTIVNNHSSLLVRLTCWSFWTTFCAPLHALYTMRACLLTVLLHTIYSQSKHLLLVPLLLLLGNRSVWKVSMCQSQVSPVWGAIKPHTCLYGREGFDISLLSIIAGHLIGLLGASGYYRLCQYNWNINQTGKKPLIIVHFTCCKDLFDKSAHLVVHTDSETEHQWSRHHLPDMYPDLTPKVERIWLMTMVQGSRKHLGVVSLLHHCLGSGVKQAVARHLVLICESVFVLI